MPKKDQRSLGDVRKQVWAFTVSAAEMVPF